MSDIIGTFKLKCGEEILLKKGFYADGTLSIYAVCEDGLPYAKISVCMPKERKMIKLADNEFFVKDWSENKWVKELLKSPYFEETNKYATNGFVVAQAWRLKS